MSISISGSLEYRCLKSIESRDQGLWCDVRHCFFIQILVATSRQKVTAIVETFVSVRQIIIICLVWALSILEYIIYQLPSTPGQCPHFLVTLWFALPKWGLGQAKREEIGRRGISGLTFTSQAHPCKGRSAKYPLPELHGVGDPPLGQANSILGRGHHTSRPQKEVNCQGFPPTVNSWKVVSQLHPYKPLRLAK